MWEEVTKNHEKTEILIRDFQSVFFFRNIFSQLLLTSCGECGSELVWFCWAVLVLVGVDVGSGWGDCEEDKNPLRLQGMGG